MMSFYEEYSGFFRGTGKLFFAVVALGIGVTLFGHFYSSPEGLLEKGDIEGFRRLIKKYPTLVKENTFKDESLIMYAVKRGNLEAVSCLIKAGADVMEVDHAGNSLLTYALPYPEVALLLLENGADASHVDYNGSTLMHLAVQSGNPFTVHALTLFDVSLNIFDADGRAPIHLALGKGAATLERLLEAGAHPDLPDQIGMAALHYAAQDDDYVAALTLVKGGANISMQSWQGWTPVHLAAIHDSTDVLCLLLESGADVDVLNKRGITPLQCAIRKNNLNAIRALVGFKADLSLKDRRGCTPLHAALEQGRTEAALLLIGAGAPVDLPNRDGLTARQMIAESGDSILMHALSGMPVSAAKSLSAN